MGFEPNDEQWEKMKKFIKSDKYKKEDFFVFETLAVGDKIVPNRFTRIAPDLLSVMKDDAQKGVSLMLNHNWSQVGVQSIPIGKVFDARLGGPSQSGETTTLYTTQYIPKSDSKVDGYSKNDIIDLIETGVFNDTSIGWGTTREAYKCSICGNPYYSGKCNHMAGAKYITDEEKNEVKECIIEAHAPSELHEGNNVLVENSIVFDGAYPNAELQSSIDNKDNSKGLKLLENKEKLSEKDIIYGYATKGNINLLYKKSNEKGGVEAMDEEELTENTPNTETQNNTVDNVDKPVEENANVTESNTENSTETNVENTNKNSTESKETLYTEKDILEKFENIGSNIQELVQLAKEGLENRNETISQALESGIRFMGNAFNKEVFTKTFSSMNTKDIKEMAETWEKQVDKKFSKQKVSKFEITENAETEKINLNDFKTTNY